MTAVVTPEQTGAIGRPAGVVARVRRTDLDALRILICATVILAHATLIFASEPPYHLKSGVSTTSATIVYDFMRATTMPMFFTLAGWSAVVSLRGRTAGGYVVERMKRLLLPLVVGAVVFGPGLKYIELSHGQDIGFHGVRIVAPPQFSFLEFIPMYLTRSKLLTWSHLWFLAYLFVISLLLLPLVSRLARYAPRAAVPSVWVVYLPGLIMAAQLAATEGYWPFVPALYKDGANLAFFALCFALGAGLAAWPGFEQRLQAEAPRLLVLMLLAFVGATACGESTAGRVFVALTAWGAIGAGLGFAARIQPTATPALSYLSEASMSVYILHHLPLLLLAIAIVPLALPVWLKIALISLAAGVVSLAAYHWLVRPWAPVRWLMGMPGKRRAAPAVRRA